jgi:hypothetical protein
MASKLLRSTHNDMYNSHTEYDESIGTGNNPPVHFPKVRDEMVMDGVTNAIICTIPCNKALLMLCHKALHYMLFKFVNFDSLPPENNNLQTLKLEHNKEWLIRFYDSKYPTLQQVMEKLHPCSKNPTSTGKQFSGKGELSTTN